eukprot:m51a1_g2278 putative elongator complex protein 3 (550) ;mRNA; r:379407-381324
MKNAAARQVNDPAVESQCVNEIVAELVRLHAAGARINFAGVKRDAAARHRLPRAPKTVAVIAAVPQAHRDALVPLIRAKPVRTASGIAAVAVMCKPARCPHLRAAGSVCVYCPGGPDSDFEYSTQSYTGFEPTSMRAVRARYDPFLQARNRIDQLRRLGHPVDKVEYIIMGGTFMSMAPDYRDYFVRSMHDALSGHLSASVEESMAYSEAASAKCVGLTIETRPDFCSASHISDLLRYGCTRLEVGVQTVYEDVCRLVNRGHTVADVVSSSVRLKDAGLKVVVHMMPDLPATGADRDVEGFRELFYSPAFRPDGLKLYPTLVMRGTKLYQWWAEGTYAPYSNAELVEVLAKVLSLVPPWVRVYRIQRDIPMPLVSSGVETGNIRQQVMRRMAALGLQCRDIRTREVGIQQIANKVRPEQVELVRRDYVASEGWETFLAYEDPAQDILVGMLRLRKPTPAAGELRPELTPGTSMVRELHVYGSAVPVHARNPRAFQHQGVGTLLMEEAERIALCEHGATRLAVIAGVGTRNYYRKLGYELEGPYMVKSLC